ncbi:MAG TPA: ABC transporter transmembrane domain-containing protein, partial [Polyangiaceae bacterium]
MAQPSAYALPDASAFQRAPGTPLLPVTPLRFIGHFVLGPYRWAFLGMFVSETCTATAGILLPYTLNRIIAGVTQNHGSAEAVVAALRAPLGWFVGLVVAELVFGRVTSSIQFRVGPRQRQMVARTLYHYLQYHSHRYFSENFAGALAHRITEAAQGVTQTLWTLVTEFWPIAIVIGVSNVLLFGTNPWLGFFTATWSVIFLGLSFFFARRCQTYAFAAAAGRSETTGHIVDSVTNISATRLFARLDFERELLERTQERELEAVL